MDTISPEQLPSDDAKAPGRPASAAFWLWFAWLLLIVLFVSEGVMWYQSRLFQQKLLAHTAVLSKSLIQQTVQQRALATEVNQLSAQLTKQQNTLSQTTAQLSQFSEVAQGNTRVFQVAEVIYLVQLADLQLSVSHAIGNALLLLNRADNQLNRINDVRLEAFHQAILKNIATLQTIQRVDVGAVASQLSSLREEVPKLSILVSPKPDTSLTPSTEHQQHKKWWQRAVDNIKASLQQLVIVRHQHDTMPALMTPSQQMYLQENLELLLTQAQWGLLHHNAAIYQDSLKTAKSWVEKYYVQNSATTQAFLKQLEMLMALNIAPTLPDLSQMLTLVNQEAA